MENIKEYDFDGALFAIQKKIADELKLPAASDRKIPLLVTLAGGSCSGKTFLAHELSKNLGSVSVDFISLDDYFKDALDPSMPRDASGRLMFDRPEAYRLLDLRRDVGNLLEGYSIWTPKYDMTQNAFISPQGRKIRPCQVIILEGLFAIKFFLTFKQQIKVYLETDYQIALQRRLKRDTENYGVPEVRVRQEFAERVWSNQELFVIPQKKFADIIVKQSK
jgi:uridine kinase